MAATKIICDTDVIIDFLNDRSERYFTTKSLIQDVIGVENVILSAITKMELIIGATNKADMQRINKNIFRFTVAFISDSITQTAIQLLQDYKLSYGLALPDALIAATALETQFPLFTYNLKDYKFIAGINLYNPQEK
ncbi:MAG: type II toxin-antitoxin system VapC family toxin [Sphingobacteriaceae bacterium]|nr:MAG: type II toxin-antitoxin system VapC family toxin [Sphingobacteriaceae bacterium]